ncbi:hypothetical protein D9M68_597860 [compost metagenome]
MTWLLKKLKVTATWDFNQFYEKEWLGELDYRKQFDKKSIHLIEAKNYFQVFSDRNDFIPNLSISDLLFNQGPQAKLYF